MHQHDLDVARARRDTPGCRRVIHLNNAGAALPPSPVTDTVVGHLEREAHFGGYEAAADAADALDGVYAGIARLLRCRADEVALTENATRAWDMAFYGLSLDRGDVIVTGRSEYSSNVLAFLQTARRRGTAVEIVADGETGEIDLAALEQTLDRLGARAKLVALTHVPTSGGLVNPAAEVGALAQAAGVPYLLDACQSVGQLDMDVAAIGCDFLSATGRKFLRAPRGTGFLYVSRRMLNQLEPPFIDLHAADWVTEDGYALRDDARRFESWESNVAARLGLGTAVEYALAWGLPAIEARVGALAERLRTVLGEVPGVTVHDQGRRRSAIVTFSVAGWDASEVRDRLRREGINTSVVAARSARLDLGRRGLGDLVRASVHYYNTEDELARLVEVLTALDPGSAPMAGSGHERASAFARPGRGDGMTDPRVHDDQPADPVEEPETT